MRYFTGLNSDTGQTEVINLEEEIGSQVEVKNGTDLVIAKASSGKSISEFKRGESLYITETENNITANYEYICIGSANDDVCLFIRKDIVGNSSLGPARATSTYWGNTMDTYVNSTYASRFASGIFENFGVYEFDSGHSTFACIPTADDLSIYKQNQVLPDLIAQYNGTATEYWTRTYVQSSTYGNIWKSVGGNGVISYNLNSWSSEASSSKGCRPVIVINKIAKVDGDSVLLPAGLTYTNTINKLQDGNNYYKFADQDARTDIATLSSQITNKIDTPAIIGTPGQVLTLDSNLNSVWDNMSSAEVKSGTDLVIAEGTVNTLADIPIGTIIKVPQTINNTKAFEEYFVVEKDATSNSTILLKRYLDMSINCGTDRDAYDGSPVDIYLTENVFNTFSPYLQSKMATKTVDYMKYWYNDTTGSVITLARKVWTPSLRNLGFDVSGTGNSWIEAIKTALGNGATDNDARYGYQKSSLPVLTRADYWVMDKEYMTSAASYKYTYYSNYSIFKGDRYYTSNVEKYVRPVISLSNSVEINGNNEVIDGITYTGTIDKLQDGNNYYKFADQEARSGLENKENKGTVTISNTEYNLERHTLSITDGGTTTTYNFLTAEVQT